MRSIAPQSMWAGSVPREPQNPRSAGPWPVLKALELRDPHLSTVILYQRRRRC
jgi:hypothetical protein